MRMFLARVQFCNWFCSALFSGEVDLLPIYVYFTAEIIQAVVQLLKRYTLAGMIKLARGIRRISMLDVAVCMSKMTWCTVHSTSWLHWRRCSTAVFSYNYIYITFSFTPLRALSCWTAHRVAKVTAVITKETKVAASSINTTNHNLIVFDTAEKHKIICNMVGPRYFVQAASAVVIGTATSQNL